MTSFKSMILGISALTVMTSASQQAYACTMTPKGDSELRIAALHETLEPMETLTALTSSGNEIYEIAVLDHSTGEHKLRTFKLENHSPMCPEYEAVLVK